MSVCKRHALPAVAVVLGITGFMLRFGLYTVGVDLKNLLVRGHPLEIALWLCTAAAVGVSLLDGLAMPKIEEYDRCFRISLLSALGHILAASGILLTVLRQVLQMSPLQPLWKICGVGSAVLLCWAAFSRTMGKRPFFGAYALTSVFFALHLVGHYQSWCADPQLQNYVFAFLATLLMMVFSYLHASFCVDMGKSQLQRMVGLLAMYCCFVAMPNTQNPELYLGCGLFAVTSLCAPKAGEK